MPERERAAALKAIAQSPPDVILLDLMMPGMDGWPENRAQPSLDSRCDTTYSTTGGWGDLSIRQSLASRDGLMSARDKLIERLRARPPEMSFEDVRRVLEAFGWQMRRGGKHTGVFKKAGERSITVPTRQVRRVAREYLDQICKHLGLDD
jgi:predicted RNA binding protein YcfA (HicA-like mRNA interferase family)